MSEPDLLPVRMLSEFAYCPRLFYLMHVDGRWADNEYTIEGQHAHRRVDRFDDLLPDPGANASAEKEAEGGDEPPEINRSVSLASERLGLVAKLDLVSTAGDEAVPVETKRGRVPNNEERSWEPERVQLMAQGMLLREHGYRCDHGVLYFRQSRTRVDIAFTPELEARTLELIEQAVRSTRVRSLPRPLEDSPKWVEQPAPETCERSFPRLGESSLRIRAVSASRAKKPIPIFDSFVVGSDLQLLIHNDF